MTAKIPQSNLTAKLHPFNPEVVTGSVNAGKTVAEAIAESATKNGVKGCYQKRVYVEIAGKPIHPDNYETTVIPADTTIIIQYCVPHGGGGGSNPLRMVLTVVLAAASIWAGGALAPMLGFAEAGLASGLISGALMMAGSMVINAICPPQGLNLKGLGHSSSAESDVYSITGMQNYSPQYKALPVVLGRVRFAPPYGALPYTRIAGNDQFLHTVVVWGQGELDVADIRVGETSYTAFNDFQIATNYGTNNDSELKLFPHDVYEEQVNAVVKQSTPVVRTGQLDSTFVQVDIVFNRGLFSMNDEGERCTTSVTLEVQYRKTGTSNWQWAATKTYSEQTAQPMRRSVQINPVEVGQYDVKVIRHSPDKAESDDKLYNEFTWGILRSVANRDPVQFDVPIAETQLVIKATDQLNGNIDTLNGVVTSVCLDYDKDNDTWVKRKTNNPASLYRHVLQGGGCAKVLEDRLIDIPALEGWHEFCEAEGFSYNYVHDAQKSTLEVLNDICHAGRATFVMLDSMRSVVIDRERVYGAVQIFTPENSVNFSMRKTFAEEVHGYRINFNNEDADFAEDEIIVYAEGYDKTNANLFEALQFPGVTNAEQAYKLGKYHLATRRYRPEVFSWESDWEHVVAARGDLISISNPSILVAQCSGQIKEVDQLAKTIRLDQNVQMDVGKDYALSVRTTPGVEASVVYTFNVTQDIEDADLLHYSDTAPPVLTRGDVYSFGESGLETLEVIVTSKRPTSNMRATITAIQYSWPEIEAYLSGAYPEHQTSVSKPVYDNPQKPPVPSFVLPITGGPAAVKRDASGKLIGRVIALVCVPSNKVAVSEVHVELREPNGSWVRSTNLDPVDAFEFENIEDGTVELRARTATEAGLVSAWFYVVYEQDVFRTAPPPTTALVATGGLMCNHLNWGLPGDFAADSRIEIHCSVDAQNRGLAQLIGTVGKTNTWTHQNLDPLLTYYYWLKIITGEGNESDFHPADAFGGIGASPITNPDMLLKQLQGERIDTNLGINGDLVAAGTITGSKMAANEVFTLALQSQNYVPNQTGYLLNSLGVAEFNNINLNLNNGGLISKDTINQDYAHLTSGSLSFYYWDGTQYLLYQSVNRLEVGVVANGETVSIAGIFRKEPRILVAPAALQTYIAASKNVDQQLVLNAGAVTENPIGSGKWEFTPEAKLTLASGTTGVLIPPATVSCGNYSVVGGGNTDRWWYKDYSSVISTGPTETIRIYGSMSYINARKMLLKVNYGSGWVTILNVNPPPPPRGRQHNSSGSCAVDHTINVPSGSYVLALRLEIHDSGHRSWIGGCSYSTGYPMYENTSVLISASTSLTFQGATSASTALAEGSLNYFAVGE